MAAQIEFRISQIDD